MRGFRQGLLGLAGLLLLGVGGTMLYLQRDSAPPPEARPSVTVALAPVAATPVPAASISAPPPAAPTPVAEEFAPLAPPPLELPSGLLPWEERIAHILAAPAPDREKARVLFSMLPSLPEEALGTAAGEAARLVHDPDYNAIALPTIANPQTHGAVLSVLFADLLERPDAVTLPALRAIAAQAQHPFAASARDDLALLTRRAR